MAKAKCVICGKEYDVCKFCPTTKQYTPWRVLCDTSEHFQIFMIHRDLISHTITPEEAKKQLDHLGVTVEDLKGLIPGVQDVFEPVIKLYRSPAKQPVHKKEEKKVPEPVEEFEDEE